MKYLIANFIQGTNPYLRLAQLAQELSTQWKASKSEDLGLIIPWMYGPNQERILKEELSKGDHSFVDKVWLDEELGSLLKQAFYQTFAFQESWKHWLESEKQINEEIALYLKKPIVARNLNGQTEAIAPDDVVLELARSPKAKFGHLPSYNVTFALNSQVLEAFGKTPSVEKTIARSTLGQAIQSSKVIEKKQKAHLVSLPGTFSTDLEQKSADFILIPPLAPPLLPGLEKADSTAIYVSVTGIPGLADLFQQLGKVKAQIFTNNTQVIPDGRLAPADILLDPHVEFQFARSGWGAVWNSLLAEKPIVVPSFEAGDDPEIYFNNLAVEKLELGVIYKRQTLAELIEKGRTLRPKIQALKTQLTKRFGTLNGFQVAAKEILQRVR